MYKIHALFVLRVLAVLALYWIVGTGVVQAVPPAFPTERESTSQTVNSRLDSQKKLTNGWTMYQSEKGGYFFSYPDTHVVREGPLAQVALFPVAVEDGEKAIIVDVLAYELDNADDNLTEWLVLYNHYYADLVQPTASPTDLVHLHKAGTQQVIIETPKASPIYQYGYLFTNGKLVWRLFTNSTDEADKQLIDKIAETVHFAEHAPRDMQALHAPNEAPMISSVAQRKEYETQSDLIIEALQARFDTGEAPIELLEQMSEQTRDRYERALENNASALKAVDEQRVSPPQMVEYTEEDYQSYLQSERDYADGKLIPTVDEDVHVTEPDAYYSELWGSASERSIFPPHEDLLSPRSVEATHAICGGGGAFPTWIIDRRRGLPTRFAPPIRVLGRVINCGSPSHIVGTGRDGYAIDISANIGTDVYGVTQNEWVDQVQNNWAGQGYGKLVRTSVQIISGGTARDYRILYAHLDTIHVNAQTYVGPSTVIAKSGNTGTTDGHLHFAIATEEDGFYPVDLSAMKGFTPDLDYPKNCAICGYTEDKDDGHLPIIIEANEFKESFAGNTNPVHSWNCSRFYPDKHTGFCYRAAVPISPQWGLDPIDINNQSSSPRMDYEIWISEAGIYRLWVCGMGGSLDDDSLHMGFDDVPRASSDRLQGFSTTQWRWASETMDGPIPYFLLNTGYRDINIWLRENGLRIDRVLLTLDHSFNPTTAGIRCGGNGLYP